jgi:hypothetical protein
MFYFLFEITYSIKTIGVLQGTQMWKPHSNIVQCTKDPVLKKIITHRRPLLTHRTYVGEHIPFEKKKI